MEVWKVFGLQKERKIFLTSVFFQLPNICISTGAAFPAPDRRDIQAQQTRGSEQVQKDPVRSQMAV